MTADRLVYKEISSSIVCTAFSFLHYSEKKFLARSGTRRINSRIRIK